MSKSYDVTKEHKQQGCSNFIEERVRWYKQMMAAENKQQKGKEVDTNDEGHYGLYSGEYASNLRREMLQ